MVRPSRGRARAPWDRVEHARARHRGIRLVRFDDRIFSTSLASAVGGRTSLRARTRRRGATHHRLHERRRPGRCRRAHHATSSPRPLCGEARGLGTFQSEVRMAAIRKSIDLILQNSTNELLTIESYNLIRGEWGPAGPPVRGDVIPKQGSKRWMSLSKASHRRGRLPAPRVDEGVHQDHLACPAVWHAEPRGRCHRSRQARVPRSVLQHGAGRLSCCAGDARPEAWWSLRQTGANERRRDEGGPGEQGFGRGERRPALLAEWNTRSARLKRAGGCNGDHVSQREGDLSEQHKSDLTVHGCAVLRGSGRKTWRRKQGADIQKQSAAVWGSESQEIVAGTSAFVRVGSVHGYVEGVVVPPVGRRSISALNLRRP